MKTQVTKHGGHQAFGSKALYCSSRSTKLCSPSCTSPACQSTGPLQSCAQVCAHLEQRVKGPSGHLCAVWAVCRSFLGTKQKKYQHVAIAPQTWSWHHGRWLSGHASQPSILRAMPRAKAWIIPREDGARWGRISEYSELDSVSRDDGGLIYITG